MSPTTRSVPRLVVAVLFTVVALVGAGCGGDDDGDGAATTVPATGSALPRFDPEGADPAAGMEIPEVTGQTFTGEEITIGPDGTAKVIVFLAHWCPHCQVEVPRIVDHLDGSPMPDDVELIGVATGTNESAPNYPPDAWLEREQWTAPTLDDADDSVAPQFGLSAFPFFVAVDADGKVVARGSGELSTDEFDRLVEVARTGSL